MDEQKLPTLRRVNVMYTLLHIAYWAMYAALAGYQTALLLERGFSSAQAGAAVAARYLAGIFAQMLLGGWADRHPEVPIKRIFGLCLLASLAVSLGFYWTRPGFLGTLLIFAALGMLELNAYPLLDSMAVQYINAGLDVRYSLARGIGSLSYAIMCVLLGRQAVHFGLESVLLTHAVLLLVVLAAAGAYPTFPVSAVPPRRREEKPHSVLWLLRGSRPYTLMLTAAFFSMLALQPLSTFMVNVVADRGGSSTWLGWGLFLMAAAELPGAFLFPALRRRLGTSGVIKLSMVFILLKPLTTLLAPNLFWVMAVQPIQMLGYGLFLPASVYYANDSVPQADRVQGQEIMMVASNGLSGMLSNLLAGWFIDRGGVNAMLLMCTVFGAVGVALGAVAVRAGRRASARAET